LFAVHGGNLSMSFVAQRISEGFGKFKEQLGFEAERQGHGRGAVMAD